MSAIERLPNLMSPFPVVSDLIPHTGLHKTIYPQLTKNPERKEHVLVVPPTHPNTYPSSKTQRFFGMVAPQHSAPFNVPVTLGSVRK